jgi:UDP-glucose 4-epimerase
MLRTAEVVGPEVSSTFTDYLRLPVVPTVWGYDARLQLLHERDLLAVLHHATLDGVHGTFNVAGDGVLMLSQALRRLGRAPLPVPVAALGPLAAASRRPLLRRVHRELTGYLVFGRGLDTTRMREVLGFVPAYTTEQAFDDFAAGVRPGPLDPVAALRRPAPGLAGPAVPTVATGADHG